MPVSEHVVASVLAHATHGQMTELTALAREIIIKEQGQQGGSAVGSKECIPPVYGCWAHGCWARGCSGAAMGPPTSPMTTGRANVDKFCRLCWPSSRPWGADMEAVRARAIVSWELGVVGTAEADELPAPWAQPPGQTVHLAAGAQTACK